MLSAYPACFFKEEKGYSVIFPDLNWLATCGDTFEESFIAAIDCLAGYIYTCQKDGTAIPSPSALDAVDPAAIAAELDTDASGCIVNMVAIDVAEYAKTHFDKPVKKTLSIPAWLNSAALEKNINFSQVLQDALKERLHLNS